MRIRMAGWLGVAIGGAGLLSGCNLLADPPADPEDQPLEVILGNPDPAYGPCLLNVDEVGAGTHDVLVFSMAGKATARILDPSGELIFKRVVEPHPAKGGGQVVEEQDQGSVRLGAGDHRVQCITSDGNSSVSLRVVPARPGHEENNPG